MKQIYKTRDAIITVIINYMSSFASGAVIFMYLGYMSQIANKDIQEVAKEGKLLHIDMCDKSSKVNTC